MITNLLDRISGILDHLQIPYMLTGSMAMVLYSEARSTQDVDIVIELKDEDVARLVPFLQDKYYYSEPTMYEEIRRRGMFNLIDYETGFKADIILRKNHIFENHAFTRREWLLGFGFPVAVIEVNDLIISKLRWIQVLESDRQKRDIQSLLKNRDIDLAYIRKWCADLNLNTFNLF